MLCASNLRLELAVPHGGGGSRSCDGVVALGRDLGGHGTAHLGGDLCGLQRGALVEILLACPQLGDLCFEVLVAQRTALNFAACGDELRGESFTLRVSVSL